MLHTRIDPSDRLFRQRVPSAGMWQMGSFKLYLLESQTTSCKAKDLVNQINPLSTQFQAIILSNFFDSIYQIFSQFPKIELNLYIVGKKEKKRKSSDLVLHGA